MTNEQTIKILDDLRSYDYDKIHKLYQDKPMTLTDALNMAIKALQEQAEENKQINMTAGQVDASNLDMSKLDWFKLNGQADGEYISRKALLEDLYKRDYTKFTHRDFVALVQYQDIVSIPPEHDGCKDCVYQDNPQDAMPCCECKQNYTDKWKAIPSADMFSDLKAEISMYENSEQSIDEMIQGIKSIISIYER